MKLMELKTATGCCGVKTLLWSPEKFRYVCPCGGIRLTIDGRPITRNGAPLWYGNPNRKNKTKDTERRIQNGRA